MASKQTELGNDLRAHAARSARENSELTFKFLEDLIKIPTDNPPGDCSVAAARVSSEFEAIGLDIERHDIKKDNGQVIPIILGWYGPRIEAPDLILNAHLDAPPVGDGWTMSPYGAERRHGRIFGRGAALAKSDVAVYTHAVAAVMRVAESLTDRSVVVAITADEGSGGVNGPKYILEQLRLAPKRAMCPGFTHAVVTAQCGCVLAKVTISSRACHQALVDPTREAMRIAIEVTQSIIKIGDELRSLGSSIPGIFAPSLNVTRISGGENFGMAPGKVEIWIDRRTLPDECVTKVASSLQLLINQLNDSSAVQIDFDLIRVAEPLRPSKDQEHWARAVCKEAETVCGDNISIVGVPLYTDARWFGAQNIPTVGYGAGDRNLIDLGINGQDENVGMHDVILSAEVVARVVAKVVSNF